MKKELVHHERKGFFSFFVGNLIKGEGYGVIFINFVIRDFCVCVFPAGIVKPEKCFFGRGFGKVVQTIRCGDSIQQ